MTNQFSRAVREFDVCIIGGGPAGLAILSGIHQLDSLDGPPDGQIQRAARHLPACAGRTVAVIDPHQQWTLDLRSPTVVHPDLFDKNPLLPFSKLHERQEESIAPGCGEAESLLSLGESQVCLWNWNLPPSTLHELIARLPHSYICGAVQDISHEEGGGPMMEVLLADGSSIRAAHVVLAMGLMGQPIVPISLLDVIRSQGHVMMDTRDDQIDVQSSTMPVPMSDVHQEPKKSKPIRIVSPSHQHHKNSHCCDLQAAEPMSSAAELERFYDRATWRMYELIRSARKSENSTSNHLPPHYSTTTPTATAVDSNEWTRDRPITMVEEDDDEYIFDLEL